MAKWRNVVGWYWQDTRCLPQLLYHSSPQLGKGRKKHNERSMGCSQDREESLNNYCKRQSRLHLGKSVLIYYKSHHSRILRKKPAILRHLPLTTPFFPGLILLLIFSTSFLMSSTERWGIGNGGFIMFSLLHLPQGKESSHSSTDPPWGPFHGEKLSVNFFSGSLSNGLQFFTNFSSMSLSWGLSRNLLNEKHLLPFLF